MFLIKKKLCFNLSNTQLYFILDQYGRALFNHISGSILSLFHSLVLQYSSEVSPAFIDAAQNNLETNKKNKTMTKQKGLKKRDRKSRTVGLMYVLLHKTYLRLKTRREYLCSTGGFAINYYHYSSDDNKNELTKVQILMSHSYNEFVCPTTLPLRPTYYYITYKNMTS